MAEDKAVPAEARRGISRGMFVGTVVAVAVVAFVAGLGLSGVVFPTKAPEAKLYIIGTNTPFPPFEYRDAEENIVGFDIDLIKEIMNRSHRLYAIQDFRDFNALLAAVQANRVNIGVSAITSSGTTGANRNQSMTFSATYYESDQAVLVRAAETRFACNSGSGSNECTIVQLTGVKIGVQAGTTSEFWVADNIPGQADNMTTYPDVSQVLQALSSSSVDLVVIDEPAGRAIASANSATYKIAGTIQTNELYSFAVAKGDPEGLLPDINKYLKQMRDDGTYTAIQNRWFH